MGNQQVSLVLTKQFVDKLVKVKSKHLLIGYYRVVKSGRGRWYVRIQCHSCSEVTDIRYEAYKSSTGSCDKCSRQMKNYRDGRSSERIYSIWNGMFSRCYNTSHPKYPRYGARGITVCGEWHRYENFRAWALANGMNNEAQTTVHKDRLSLDRVDPLRGYTPDNCRVVTVSQNSSNTKDTRTRKLQRLSRKGVDAK